MSRSRLVRGLASVGLVGLVAGLVITPRAVSSAGEPEASKAPDGNAVLLWNATAGEAAVAACIAPTDNPLHESRMYESMHIAIHDALNAIHRRYDPYALFTRADLATASPEAAVASAARDVLVAHLAEIPAPFPPACLDAGTAVAEEAYADALAAIDDGTAKTQGVRLGQAAAALILAARTGDGSDTPLIVEAFPEGDEPGEYRFTPGTPFAFAPGWGDVEPFVLRDAGQFDQGGPYPLRSARYAADFAEVKRLGGDGVSTPSQRTPDQTEIARFWVESSPLQWNRLGRTVAGTQGLELWKAARLFALLNMSLADGYIGTFAGKYDYLFWRPVTAIRAAGTDGNQHTTADPTWSPLVTTPPIPDHDSGHSVEGGAAAEVLARVMGTDRVGFTLCSNTLLEGQQCGDAGEVLRSYTSFSQASEENALSRILVGFHFRHAVEDGKRHGRLIADRAVDRFLRPVHGH